MFGVEFHRPSRSAPHPDAGRLAGFPQRKDYPLEGPGELLMENPLDWLKLRQAQRRGGHRIMAVTNRRPFAARCSTRTSSVLNMGPQHPSTHGVLRVVLRLDGEKVVDADVVIGYLHRGIEKLSENRNWTQIILLTDRMDYVAAATSNVGYCETVEKLMQRRGAAARALRPHHPLRAAADCEPLPLARHARDGHRRDDGVPLRVPRARADSRPVRGVLRRAAHLQLDAHRRAAAGYSAGLGQEGPRVLRHHGRRRSTSTRRC